MQIYKLLLVCLIAIIGLCRANDCSDILWAAAEGSAVKFCRNAVIDALDECCVRGGSCRRVYEDGKQVTCNTVSGVQRNLKGSKSDVENYLKTHGCSKYYYQINFSRWFC